ncbi:MAG TPA: hypothetical protein DHU59_06860 [Clostridiales bacterium]|nr:hypothetical protein [Clostridiales bacterium]
MFLADNIGNNTSATSIGNILVNEGLLNEGFDGSFPKLLAAFTRRKKLSSKEICELQKLIDEHREE